MLLPAPCGVGGEALSHPQSSRGAWENGDPESLPLYDIPSTPSNKAYPWHQVFSFHNSPDVLCQMEKKGKFMYRRILILSSGVLQKCHGNFPLQILGIQSLIFHFETLTWVLLLPSWASVLLKHACSNMKWKFPQVDVAAQGCVGVKSKAEFGKCFWNL